MNIVYLNINPLESKQISIQFYFPKTGNFSCYPATVTKDNEVLGMAIINQQIKVLDKKLINEQKTINEILSEGKIEDIKLFLST